MTSSPKHYRTPGDLRQAFARRHRDDPARELVVLMQRFAARVCSEIEGAVIKGGLGLELRLDTPRTTEDADIIIAGSHDLARRLQAAGNLDLGDFLKFTVNRPRSGADFTVPGMSYSASRHVVQARFADGPPPWPGQVYRKFTVEISVREAAGYDTIVSELDGFPQASPADIRVYSLEWQIAEKIHAYTDPRHRDTDNKKLMRPRDLLDLCRCAVSTTTMAIVESEELRSALKQTFERRQAAASIELQDLPTQLPSMPVAWTTAFEQQVMEASLPWQTPEQAHAIAAEFLDPVLNGSARGVWHPARKEWAPA